MLDLAGGHKIAGTWQIDNPVLRGPSSICADFKSTVSLETEPVLY